MPLSKPIVSIIAMSLFLSNWNDFLWPWLVTESQELYTLNVALFQLSRIDIVKPNFLMGLSAVTLVPIVALTALLSGRIRESIASSGIKG